MVISLIIPLCRCTANNLITIVHNLQPCVQLLILVALVSLIYTQVTTHHSEKNARLKIVL